MKEQMKSIKKHHCCICGKEFTGWGNNPWPVKEEGTCCDECNLEVILPIRLSKISFYEETMEDDK